MKKSKYPRLRSHARKGKSGQVWTWWTYDMRPEGGTEISLGNDYAKALEQWHKLHNHAPMIKGTIQEAIDKWRLECLHFHACGCCRCRSQVEGRTTNPQP